MKDRNLSGKLAIVTGGSRGIGYHITRVLHGAGATVAITGRFVGTLDKAAKEAGSRCRPYVCDQRKPEAIESMSRAVLT